MKNKLPLLTILRRFQKASSKSGLFGNALLTTPAAFQELSKQTQKSAYELVEQIVSGSRPGGRSAVALVDDLSNIICSAADLAECVRSIHSDQKFALAANEAMRDFTNLVETLNTNQELFAALKDSMVTDANSLDEVDRRTLALLVSDFEQSGVHLPDRERREFVQLSNEIFEASTHFAMNTDRPVKVSPEEQKRYNVNFIDTPYPNTSNSEIKEFYFRQFYSHSSEQEGFLARMIGARHRLAQLTGYESYAHRSQFNSILGTYDDTKNFLNSIITNFSDTVDPELNMVRKALSDFSIPYAADKPLPEWEYNVGCSMARQQLVGTTESLSRYFHFETLLKGFELLMERLYDIRFNVSLPVKGEVWDGKVVKVDVSRTGSFLGTVYIDLDHRASKMSGDCHYTVQCSKQLATGDFQTPIVVISLAAADASVPLENLTMRPYMAENFFHEMGHAMHSMLGHTRYQHIAGTRCPTDMAEVPSNLMEFLFNDPRVLKVVCKDASGRAIQDSETQALVASKSLFSGVDLLQQTNCALFDLEVHGPEFAPAIAQGKLTSTKLYGEISNHVLPQLHRGAECAWPQRFAHLAPYGSKYYSYLVAKAAASLVYNQLFKTDPFSREAGLAWAKVQSFGGELASSKLLALALGRTPTAGDFSQALRDNYIAASATLREQANNGS